MLTDILTSEKRDSSMHQNWQIHPEDRYVVDNLCICLFLCSAMNELCRGIFGGLCYPRPSMVLSGYRLEWAIQLTLVVVYIAISYGAKAPGCPV